MNILKKLVSFSVAGIMIFGTIASAANFSDMPTGAVGVAISNAVANGLLTGYEDGTVKPDEPITRAQMATILVRAFGATETAATGFSDVAEDAWYASSVSRAAAMKIFQGDENGKFNPNNHITFQETYTTLARAFQFEQRTTSSGKVVLAPDDTCLDSFPDKNEVADWAVGYAKAVVGNGGYTGIDGKLKPTSKITRGEFALIMDELVSLYIDKPGTYNSGFGNGSVVVRSGDVTIEGLDTNKNLILSYGIKSTTEVKSSRVQGCIVIYGGTDDTPVDGRADESMVYISAHMNDVRIFAPVSRPVISWLNENPRDVSIKSYVATADPYLGTFQ